MKMAESMSYAKCDNNKPSTKMKELHTENTGSMKVSSTNTRKN